MRKNSFIEKPGILAQSNRRRVWRKVVGVLSCVVVFFTTYAMLLPAITLEKAPAEEPQAEDSYTEAAPVAKSAPVCTPESLGLHTHTEVCLGEDGQLCCGEADFLVHKHDDRCYDENGQLWCPIPEKEAHTHDESCYSTPEVHLHGEGCYTGESGELTCTELTDPAEPVLSCGKEEIRLHQHTQEVCFAADEEGNTSLICRQLQVLEHLHTDGCFQTVEEPADTEILPSEAAEPSVLSVVSPQADVARVSTDITLYPGQLHTVEEVYTNDIQITGNEGAAEAASFAYTDILRIVANNDDHLYTGDRVTVDDALYTFTAVGENSNTFKISHGDLCLNFKDADAEGIRLSSRTEDTILFTDKTDTNSTYHHFLMDGAFALSSGDKYLFFHGKKGDENQYAFNLKDASWLEWCGGGFLLFRKAVGDEPPSAVIPGFVQVTQKSQITNGQYLIAAKAQDADTYYVLYPKLDAAERHQHAAKVSPYKLTIMGKTVGTTTVTAGKQTWNVTVSDQMTVSPGKSISVPLAESATVTSADPTTATVAIASGTATVTGVKEGNTTATVTTGDQTYTWNITVTKPNSFKFTYPYANHPVITFHFKNKETEADLEVERVVNYEGQPDTKYRLVTEGTPSTGEAKVVDIPIPAQIDGLPFSGAIYYRSWREEYRGITCFATTGYSDSDVTVQNDWNFLFYDEAAPSTELNLNNEVSSVDVYLYYANPPITNTVSPSGTIINLFDYWVTGENEGQVSGDRPTEGINKDHALHFTTNGDALPLNQWTGSIDVQQGIVANRLGSDGYPHLSGNESATGSASEESLAYLFDTRYTGPSAAFRKAYRNVGGLLQLDDQGYYYYDSTENYAEFDPQNNLFHLYPVWAVTHATVNGQFFPFDPYSTVSQRTTVTEVDNSGGLNHFFGMTMSTRFMQQYGGHTSTLGGVPMTFEFAGDDDVWIFIDGVLAADLGGIHDAASVKIDFAAGTVVINENKGYSHTKSFREIFADTNVKLTGNTLQDNSYHTLKFYYMERGGVASNLHLKFNLVTFPASGITKVDQESNPITGAEFSLYRTGADYVVAKDAKPICSGATDTDGEFIFTDSDGQPLVLQDLYLGRDKNQQDPAQTYPYYVLQETRVPQGYRGTGTDIHLLITESSGNGQPNVKSYVMTCTNTRDSGAYASPSLQVTASNELTLADGTNTKIHPGASNGTLFGIVLKYIGPEGEGKDLMNAANWSPVYGSASEGYTVVDREQEKYQNILDAVQAAKDHYLGKQNYFRLSSNGSYQALIEDLPGDITTYNFMAGSGNREKVQYMVAYYWTDTATNTTTRVQDYTTNAGTYSFSRTFGTDIHVPNMKNRIAVQKLDEDNVTPVNGARFVMYRVDDYADAPDHSAEAYFYVPDGATQENMTHLFLESDTGGTFQGNARLCTDTVATGKYEVDRETGIITVTITTSTADKNGTYTITPTQVVTTVDRTQNNYMEDGIAEFEGMVSDKYIIRELTAPPGYEVNPHRVMVLVTDNAIYANAGDADDGIAVSRGAGYLAGNLHYYATIGDIDNTLSWVCTQMKVSGVSDSFSDITPQNYGAWKWIQTRRVDANGPDAKQPTDDRSKALTAYLKFQETENGSGSAAETSAQFSYAVDDNTDRPASISKNVALDRRLYTKTGWSYLEVLQDYDYGKNSRPDGPKSPNANYANWQYVPGTEVPDDLSNLLSRSIYVHVTDPKLPGDLEITKTVAAKEGQTVPAEAMNTSFTFTVNLANPNKPVDGTYKYTVYDDSNGTRTVAVGADGSKLKDLVLTVTDGTATLSLKNNQAVVIRDLPSGSSYEITEAFVPKFAAKATEKVLITDSGGSRAGTKEHNGSVVSGSMYWHVKNDVLDDLSKVDFTNTYDETLHTVTMTVQKVNAENQNVRLPGAEFRLTKTTADGKTLYNTGTEWTETETALSTNHSGQIQFSLIEAGTYTLTEVKAPFGYYPLTAPITIEVEEVGTGAAASKRIKNASFGTVGGENSLTLIVPNSAGYELPESGGMGTTLIYLLGGLLVIGAGLTLLTKKRMSAKK